MARAFLTALFLLPIAATYAAQAEVSRFTGDWHGDSLCIAKNTACRDESVVYHIAALPGKSGYFTVDADKIVDGKPVNMGTLEFRYDPDRRELVCEYSQGVWRLRVDARQMEGSLTRPDGTVFRRTTLRQKT